MYKLKSMKYLIKIGIEEEKKNEWKTVSVLLHECMCGLRVKERLKEKERDRKVKKFSDFETKNVFLLKEISTEEWSL